MCKTYQCGIEYKEKREKDQYSRVLLNKPKAIILENNRYVARKESPLFKR